MINKFKIHFLKTFWSDCILLECNNKFALIDTGSVNDKDYILSYLKNLNIKDLDFVLITHFHCDHYGCLYDILQLYTAKSVYIKEYSGLDGVKANGELADDNYRKNEMDKYNNLVEYCKKKKMYKSLDKLEYIYFNDFKIKIFNNEDNLKKVYNDKKMNEYYRFSENFNSLALYFEVYNNNIYLPGDILDLDDKMDEMKYLNYKICRILNKTIDIYKASHHGMDNGTSYDTLEVIKPKNIIVTNHKESLKNNNNIQNSNCNIYYTNHTVVFEINDKGEIRVIK